MKGMIIAIAPDFDAHQEMLASEATCGKLWDNAEEDTAWRDL